MPTDEQLRRVGVYPGLYSRGVPAGVAADVRHPHIYILAFKAQVQRVGAAYILPVDIAINTTQGFKGGQFIGQFNGAEIARVPYLVAVLEMLEYGII